MGERQVPSFLLASLNYYIADQRDAAAAQKRRGVRLFHSMRKRAETRYRLEPVDARTPESIFEHRWALTLLDQVPAQPSDEFAVAGKSHLFKGLQPFLVEGVDKPYAEVAAELGLSEEAFAPCSSTAPTLNALYL